MLKVYCPLCASCGLGQGHWQHCCFSTPVRVESHIFFVKNLPCSLQFGKKACFKCRCRYLKRYCCWIWLQCLKELVKYAYLVCCIRVTCAQHNYIQVVQLFEIFAYWVSQMHQSCLGIWRFYLCGAILKTSNLCDFLIKNWTLCLYVALVFPDGQSWLRHLILEGWYLVGLCSIEKTRQTILWLTCLPFH